MRFSFSEPMSVENHSPEAPGQEDVVKEAIHPFIFSPPLTRAKRRDSIKDKSAIETVLGLGVEEIGPKRTAKKRYVETYL